MGAYGGVLDGPRSSTDFNRLGSNREISPVRFGFFPLSKVFFSPGNRVVEGPFLRQVFSLRREETRPSVRFLGRQIVKIPAAKSKSRLLSNFVEKQQGIWLPLCTTGKFARGMGPRQPVFPERETPSKVQKPPTSTGVIHKYDPSPHETILTRRRCFFALFRFLLFWCVFCFLLFCLCFFLSCFFRPFGLPQHEDIMRRRFPPRTEQMALRCTTENILYACIVMQKDQSCFRVDVSGGRCR